MPATDSMTVETLLTHSGFVRSLARRLVADPEHADDAVQQAWLEACEHPPRHQDSPRGWLATATRNAVRKIRRSEVRRDAREHAVARAEGVTSTAEIVEREEARRKLVDAVLALEEPYRSAIVLRYLDQLPPRDVARRLNVPVETARTRIKRGLTQLRSELDDSFGGDRRAWGLALMPWAIPVTRSASAISATMVAASVAVVGLGTLGYFALTPSAPLAPTPAGVAARIPPLTPNSGNANAGSGDATGTAEGRAPLAASAAAAVPAQPGRLELLARLGKNSIATRQPITFIATFKNTGGEALKFYKPEHVGMVPFPRWRLTADDGSVYKPARRSFQSMWKQGIQGDVRELAPKGIDLASYRTSTFIKVDRNAAGSSRKSIALPPGRYRVSCVYEQTSNEVPVGEANFKLSKQKVEGLWTGKVTAPDVWLVVTGATQPILTVDAPNTTAGAAAWLNVTFNNAGRTPVTLGDLRVSLHVKATGGGAVIVPRAAMQPVNRKALPQPLVLGAKEKLTVKVDLAKLSFERKRRNKKSTHWSIYEMNPQGTFSCSVSWKTKEQAKPLQTSTWLRVAANQQEPKGLHASIVRVGGTTVQLRLANVGEQPLRLRKRLAWPRDFRVSFTAKDKKTRRAVAITTKARFAPIGMPEPASIVALLAWDGGAYEKPGPLTKSDFATLPVGGVWTRTVDLNDLISDPIPNGTYEVRATWRNVVDGRHLNLPPTVIGTLKSKPLTIKIEGN